MSRRLIPALLVIAAVVVGLIVLTRPADNYVVYVQLADGAGILKNYNVKVGQIPAGKVTDITLDDHDHAILKLELDPEAVPIGTGATAKVRPVNLLGEKYVDLDPGDLDRPLPSGTTIPLARTGVPVEIDDALNMLDPDTRGALRILINEAGLSMAGRGADFNRMITELPPALDSARQVVGEVAAENTQLKDMVTRGDRVLAALSSRSGDLTGLVRSAGNALQATADRRKQLGETVRGAPSALAQLGRTLGNLQAASVHLQPAADDLRATAPALAQTLDRLPPFARDARGALAEAGRVAPRLARLGRAGTPTLRRLRPTARHLASFAGDLQPLIDTLDQKGGLQAVEGFVAGWAGVTDTRDGLGHVFRLGPTIDERLLTSVLERYVDGQLPSTPGHRTARRRVLDGTASDAVGLNGPGGAALNAVAPSIAALGKAVGEVGGSLRPGAGPSASDEAQSAGTVLNYLLGQ